MQDNARLSLILLLSLGFIWGTGYSIARFAMTNGVPPLGYSFWQSIGPALLLILTARIFRPSDNQKLYANNLMYYLVCALTGIVIPNTNMYFAAQHLPAGLLAVIVNTVPIIAYPLSLIVRIEKFCWRRLIGVLFAISGLMMLVLPKASLPSPNLIPWIFSTLITPLSFAFCSVYIARFQPKAINSIQSSAGMLCLSSLILAPLVIGSHNFYPLHYPLTLSDQIILLEIVLSSVGYVLYFKLIKTAGPVYYSFVDTIVSLTGLIWGYIIFHERLNYLTGSAVLLILFALILVNKTVTENKLNVKASASA